MASTVVVRLAAVVLLLAVVSPAIAVDAARLNGAVSPAGANEAEVATLGGIMDCLGAVGSLESCINEILHFLVGQSSAASVSTGCCRAVKTVVEGCWPGVLASVGLTSKQAAELLVHCTANPVAPPPPPAAGQTPAPAGGICT